MNRFNFINSQGSQSFRFMIIRFFLLFIAVFSISFSNAQSVSIKGRIFDKQSNEALPFVNILVQGTGIGTASDINGLYKLENIQPGLISIEVSSVGYKRIMISDIKVTRARTTDLDIGLERDSKTLDVIEISASAFTKRAESPLSLYTIGASEIERNPGGGRDISKVLQSLPGVAGSVGFRNDIIIRGGAPNENRFYLDGIEVPNINHFATQGSSGGPVGMINVDLIREVEFYSGAFPANRGNALSSVLEFKQKDGNSDHIKFTATVGSSDLGLTMDGPLSDKGNYIFSIRRSYLQLLFKAIGLPFLPTYNDTQVRVKWKFNKKNELLFLGLGAIDDFVLNEDANETELQRYLLANLPVNNQWNYTSGFVFKHYEKNSFYNFIISRNHLNNSAVKYLNNDKSNISNKLLDYQSEEIENKARLEYQATVSDYKISASVNFENVNYSNSTFNRISLPGGISTVDFNSNLEFNKMGFSMQLNRSFFKNQLSVSTGIRFDANDYSSEMADLFDQMSPRISFSYALTDKWNLNANAGIYYQLPSYTVLGYRDNLGVLINKQNGVKYIQCDQVVAGVEYRPGKNSRITLEGFHKQYSDYPFLTNDSISLANLGADFGVIGNAPVISASKGRSKGIEFLLQQKMNKGYYGIFSYTFVNSEFTDKSGEYLPSAWDNKHIISVTGGKKLKRNWEIGAKWRYLGGAPYTPYDLDRSSTILVWDVTQMGLPDYSKLNSERIKSNHQLDVRIDKKYFWRKISFDFYIDIENLYNFQTELQPYLLVKKDASGNNLIDPNDQSKYQTKLLDNTSGNVLPSIGLILEW